MAKRVVGRKCQKMDWKICFKKIKMTYYCSYMDKEYTVEASPLDWSYYACDCGSHRSLSYTVHDCACGRDHSIDIDNY